MKIETYIAIGDPVSPHPMFVAVKTGEAFAYAFWDEDGKFQSAQGTYTIGGAVEKNGETAGYYVSIEIAGTGEDAAGIKPAAVATKKGR
jgi:hypothetical protein